MSEYRSLVKKDGDACVICWDIYRDFVLPSEIAANKFIKRVQEDPALLEKAQENLSPTVRIEIQCRKPLKTYWKNSIK